MFGNNHEKNLINLLETLKDTVTVGYGFFAPVYECDTKNAAIQYFDEDGYRVNEPSFAYPVHVYRQK